MNNLINDIISFALSKNTVRQRTLCIVKGILFLPFLAVSRKARKAKDDVVETIGAGEDIYPLF